MENYRPKRPKWHAGGQHRPTVGVSTFDGETDSERIERLRRTYAELGEPFDGEYVQRMLEPQPATDDAALAEFNRELQQAIDGVDWSQPF